MRPHSPDLSLKPCLGPSRVRLRPPFAPQLHPGRITEDLQHGAEVQEAQPTEPSVRRGSQRPLLLAQHDHEVV